MSTFLNGVALSNGQSVASLTDKNGSAAVVKEATARFPSAAPMEVTSVSVREDLMAVLSAHSWSSSTYKPATTDVILACEGDRCHWSATVTGNEDKRGFGERLFTAHQAAMIEDAFELTEHEIVEPG